MAEHNELGKEGERAAAYYLIKKGYEIREMSWLYGHRDIDIIAEKPGLIIFVEVKTRSNEEVSMAVDAITKDKEMNLIFAASAYLKYYHIDTPARFDVITVVGSRPPFEITHIKDAFSSPLFR